MEPHRHHTISTPTIIPKLDKFCMYLSDFGGFRKDKRTETKEYSAWNVIGSAFRVAVMNRNGMIVDLDTEVPYTSVLH
jgi:hypothetical protein